MEIYLREDILDDWININGYRFVRRDCDLGFGGGVLIYFKVNFIVYLVICWNCIDLEVIWLNVILRL